MTGRNITLALAVAGFFGTGIGWFVALTESRQLDRVHPRYVQECVLDSDDMSQRSPQDCEARWQRALAK